jgi:uncharacterized protein YegP (UPF0339 family)
MRHIDRRGGSTRIGVRGAMLVTIALFAMLAGPSLAAALAPSAHAPVNTTAPSLTGTPTVGSTLSCSQGVWAYNPTTFAYAWLRSGVPIPGQTGNTYVVQASDQGHAISCQVTAAKQVGEYTIQGLQSGSYKVYFRAANEELNFLSEYFSGKSTFEAAETVSATAGSTIAGINAALQGGGQIAGRVIEAGGSHAALPGIEVCARDTSIDSCAHTSATGEYTIAQLPSGTYAVEFSGYRYELTEYLTQYYNGKATEGEAEKVTVTAPGTTAGIDAEMHIGGQIKGKVTDASSHADLQRIEVCARGTGVDNCASTNAGGEYSISGLPGGQSYKVEFYPESGFFGYGEGGNYLTQYYNDKTNESEAEGILVATSETVVSSINAEMHAGGEIKGKITAASTHAPIEGAIACAFSSEDEACGVAKAGGEYAIVGLPTGSYEVEFVSGFEAFFGFSQNYLPQFYNGKETEAEAETVAVTAPNAKTGIDAELRSGGQIEGKVTDAVTHAPLANFEVCASGASGGYGASCAYTNSAGEYTVGGLASGSYAVSFSGYGCESESCEQLHNYALQYYAGKSLSKEATPVAVSAPGVTSGINAEMRVGAKISGKVTNAANGAPIGGIEVCAENIVKEGQGGCATTNAASSFAGAASNALSIPAPNANFTQAKAPRFDPKTDDLDFFFDVSNAGEFHWSLFFRNADVGFADSLGISLGEGAAVAETARRKHAKAKPCKKSQTRHKGKCVATLVSFSSGSQSVPAGAVEIKVHADSKALKALKAGHTLHVSGTFTFQSALGGPPVAHTVSAVVHLSKKAARGKRHGKGKRR